MATDGPAPTDPAPEIPEQPTAWCHPLARSDRTESAAALLLLGLWLVALPICVVGGFFWWQHLVTVVADQQGSRVSVVAITTADAKNYVITHRGEPLEHFVPVDAHWVGATGATSTGKILAPAGAAAGTKQQVWIDRSGVLAEAPLDSTGAGITVVLGTGALWLCWGGLLYCGRMLLRYGLDRQRMADLDSDWLQVEPRWSGRHPDHDSSSSGA